MLKEVIKLEKAVVNVDIMKETPRKIKLIAEEIIWIVDNKMLKQKWQNEILSRTKEINSAIAKLPA